MIAVKVSKDNKKTAQILRELERRLLYIESETNRVASYIAAEEIVRRLPKGKYRESIDIFQTPDGDTTAFGVHSKASNNKQISKTYLVYVRPKKAMKKEDPVAKILAAYSPWTVATLPYVPDPEDAEIITREVNANLADRVERMRNRQRRTIDPQLHRAGARKLRDPRNLDKLSKTMNQSKTTEDLVVYGTSMEFGWTKDAKPHWRPAIELAKRTTPKFVQRLPNIRKSLYNNQYRGWARPNRPETQITEAEGARYSAFAKIIRR